MCPCGCPLGSAVSMGHPGTFNCRWGISYPNPPTVRRSLRVQVDVGIRNLREGLASQGTSREDGFNLDPEASCRKRGATIITVIAGLSTFYYLQSLNEYGTSGPCHCLPAGP